MKTSNYIIISFFVFLFGGILVLFIAAKFYPKAYPKWIFQEKTLEDFSVIVAEPGAVFFLNNGEQPKIKCSSILDTCYFPMYAVRNDTLFVSSYQDNKTIQHIDVFCKSIKSIQGRERSNININKFHFDTLIVKLEQSVFRFSVERNSSKSSSVKLIANQSNVDMGQSNFDKLEIQIGQTNFNTSNSDIISLSGSLKDHSNLLFLGKAKNVNLEVDSTSTYQIYK
jgi:hypothetical protein